MRRLWMCCFMILLGMLVGCRPISVETPPTMTPTSVLSIKVEEEPTAVPTPVVTQYSYQIVNSYPHDTQAFTQGLVWEDGFLYEGTGLHGRSSLRQVDLESGRVEEIYLLPEQYFGEGITIIDDRVYQITWQAQTAFVYDQDSFELIESFTYPTEGWGITHDGERLIMSDGTDLLYFRDPDTFAEIGRVSVQFEGRPVSRINELEYINGRVYANIWQTEQIIEIDPATGMVTGWLDLSGLLSAAERQSLTDPGNAVLNGIAYDAEQDRLFVTGKLWPQLFEIELVAVE